MSKYLCLMCMKKFRRENQTITHMEEFDNHVVVKRFWRPRLLEWLLTRQGKLLTKIIGFFIIYCVIIKHFNIEWSMIEAALIGIGIGLAID